MVITRGRVFTIVIAVFLAGACIVPTAAENSASGNLQKIIPLDSPAYAAIDSLYLEQGLVLPSASRPYSAAEFRTALDRVHPEGLSKAGKASYLIVERVISHRSMYREPGGLSSTRHRQSR